MLLLHDGGTVSTADAAAAMRTDELTAAQQAHGGLGPEFFDELSWSFGQAVYPDGPFDGLGASCGRLRPALA